MFGLMWWCELVISALGGMRQEDGMSSGVQGQPGLHSETLVKNEKKGRGKGMKEEKLVQFQYGL
jgi:hypothetical protein